ncbi:hypothetical protein [Halarcobacter anaerophilus]|jgi:hypothetical protein|uniref:Uncharacterized protein n=1 Tax=Halarcobacter anaerophilus TaxID=877500 RepID=A0A4V1LPH0_9BACT|nr:hypothetical protein [Halarcobacter anaerophilus]QDF30314.1 hypothetical protein AANAER_2873 [Halarcobacter anaerophilus]RXJ61168.1 hypothetical protein CRV06_14545 [Halarcobacter anaerophilus]
MKVYLYAKSGHAIGLDATRRCAAIAKLLQEKDCDPILCTCDFRAGVYAKEELGIKKYVSVDVLSNLPNIMQRGDILIYDTDEASDFMQTHMKDFCTLLYKIPEDIPYTITHNDFFKKQEKHTIEKLFFFGDDDYDNRLLKLCENSEKQNISLLWGHYFFLGNEEKLVQYFNEILNEESYIDSIRSTKYLLSGSLNACIESIKCGGSPVLLRRDDKEYDENLIKKLKLPTVKADSFEDMIKKFETIIEEYPKINFIDNFDINLIINEIFVKLEAYKKLTNNI